MPHESLRAFRRNAIYVREGLALLHQQTGRMQMDGGYLQDEGRIERYKQISIPVRRALNSTDRASFTRALTELTGTANHAGQGVASPAAAIDREWQRLQTELDSTVGLAGVKVTRRQILAAWLDAAAFYDRLDRDRAYDGLMDQFGNAAESIGSSLTEDVARVILLLDEAAAAALGEPVILPPPQKMPPPPPERTEAWWKRVLRRTRKP